MKRMPQRFDISYPNRIIISVLLMLFFILFFYKGMSQNVGIGTPTPLAKLHVAENSVVFSATGPAADSLSIPPVTGQGRRMMWFANKAAFRVGYVEGNLWDATFIGKYSIAAGYNNVADGPNAIAMGINSQASGASCVAIGENCIAEGTNCTALGFGTNTFFIGATAMGYGSNAFGDYSTAMGYQSAAQNNSAVAMGYQAHAGGVHSTAMGENTAANGTASTAMGSFSTATGQSAIAMGDNVTASGQGSIAMGNYVSTSNFNGCVTMGDRSTTTVMNTFVANGFRARFAGGYRLFTNSDANVGAFLNSGANSWAALSDIRKKENFLPVDGEFILGRIAEMPQYTWNYIGQDVKTLRHYGPMGQEFFKAFGHDELGEIGCDTLINQQDFLGVSFVAIQALEKRTQQIKELENMVFELRKEIDELKKKVRTKNRN